MSEGLDISHNFLFFEDDENESINKNGLDENNLKKLRRRSIYLLKRNKKCDCCLRAEFSMFQPKKISPLNVTDLNSI